MAGEISIRSLRPEDAARVKAITLEGFGPVSVEAAIERRWPDLLPTAWGERKWQTMQPEVRDHPEWCFVAEAGGGGAGRGPTPIPERDEGGRIPDLGGGA